MTESLSRFALRYYTQPQLPKNWYVATCDDIGLGNSQHGTPMVVMSWKLSGDNDYKYLWRVPLVDADFSKLVAVHKAFELPIPSLGKIRSGEQVLDKDDYLGNTALVLLLPEWFQSKRRSVMADVRHMGRSFAFVAVARPKTRKTPDEVEVEKAAKETGL